MIPFQWAVFFPTNGNKILTIYRYIFLASIYQTYATYAIGIGSPIKPRHIETPRCTRCILGLKEAEP